MRGSNNVKLQNLNTSTQRLNCSLVHEVLLYMYKETLICIQYLCQCHNSALGKYFIDKTDHYSFGNYSYHYIEKAVFGKFNAPQERIEMVA